MEQLPALYISTSLPVVAAKSALDGLTSREHFLVRIFSRADTLTFIVHNTIVYAVFAVHHEERPFLFLLQFPGSTIPYQLRSFRKADIRMEQAARSGEFWLFACQHEPVSRRAAIRTKQTVFLQVLIEARRPRNVWQLERVCFTRQRSPQNIRTKHPRFRLPSVDCATTSSRPFLKLIAGEILSSTSREGSKGHSYETVSVRRRSVR